MGWELEVELEFELDVSAFATAALPSSELALECRRRRSLELSTIKPKPQQQPLQLRQTTPHTPSLAPSNTQHAYLRPTTPCLVPALQTKPHDRTPPHRRPPNPRLHPHRTPRSPARHAPGRNLQRNPPRRHASLLPSPPPPPKISLSPNKQTHTTQTPAGKPSATTWKKA
jgi:hypothetical protein